MKISPGEIVAKKYKIEKKIGEGATGIVYLAKDEILTKFAAIKFLRLEYSLNVAQRKRFLNEARVASHFIHESIVVIREVSEWQGHLYIVMDYHEGKTLKEIMQEKLLTKDEIHTITKQLLLCLEDAHKKNIIHRDIKPSNIIVYYDKNNNLRLKILDFGLASCEEYQNNISGGTLNYVSPEQLLDDPVDHRSDLYSVAVCIYEMYTGILPVSGSTANEFVYNLLDTQSHAKQKPQRMLPSQLRKILLKGLASDPESRYQNANYFWKEVRGKIKFSYSIVIEKVVTAAALLLILWSVSSLWSKYSTHSSHKSLLNEAIASYENKEWQKAIEFARKSQEIATSYKAKQIIANSAYAQVQQDLVTGKISPQKVKFPQEFNKKTQQILTEYIKFYQTSQEINQKVSKQEYDIATSIIKSYRGLKNHEQLLHKQLQRLQVQSYRKKLNNALQQGEAIDAKKWYDKLQNDFSPEESKRLHDKIYNLNKQSSYEKAMQNRNYWKAIKVAKTRLPLWQTKYEAAQQSLRSELQSCLIVSPTTGKILSQRLNVVEINIPPHISSEYLRVNGAHLNYSGNIYSAEIILPQGQQHIRLEYYRENYKDLIHKVMVNVDIIPPKLQVTKHFIEDNSRNIVIEGTVQENTRVDTIFYGEYEAQPLNASFSRWQISFPLALREQSIELTARDIAGNNSTYKYAFTTDNTAPEVYIEFPKENEKIYSRKVMVQGIAIDDSQIEEITVMSKKVSKFKKDKWYISIQLPKNLQSEKAVIPITVKDIWGNTKEHKVTVLAEFLKWKDMRIFRKLNLYSDRIWGLCFDHEGKYLVGAGNDGKKVVWSTSSYKPISIQSTSPVTSQHLKISPAIRFTASFFADITGKSTPDFFNHSQVGGVWRVSHSDLYDRDLGDLIRFFDRHISCMALSPDGRYLAMGHHSGNLRIIDLHRRRYVLHSNVHNGVVLSLCYSPDGKWLASGGGDYRVKLWPISKKYNKKLREKHVLKGHKMSVTALSFTHNSTVLASGSKDKKIHLWDVEKGTFIKKLSGHTSQIESISFSPVEMTLCSASAQGEMFIWK
ncbi:WD40 repeat domain-containing serine/threonine protein kinase [Candidatus Uabimicrobium sp. HlEnr_7]|uniref:WD40 repeat domain-containing serine/threonine protein kinase n=1 Tax=Candidatus Uabimicrobium helgolandensis TaxID=3095367 RepID=UPI003559078E